MNLTQDSLRLVAASACALGLLAGCGGGGDIKINPSSTSTIR
jgi:hypothetical protein